MKQYLHWLACLAAFAAVAWGGAGCAKSPDGGLTPAERTLMTIQITSPAFASGSPIPAKHTCDDRDASPALAWTNVPPAAKSLALICDDPDAPVGTWVHWVVYDLPPGIGGLEEDLPKGQYLANKAKQGLNDFQRLGYGGPCPPSGSPHRYFFKLYALDQPTDLNPGATKADLLKAMQGHILAEGQLMGTYKRK